MAIFKCKMCGGDLNVENGTTVVECEYCGTKQTVPQANDEKKINLYNRANRLRMNSEFDKAGAIYEQIIAEFPEESEAYWCLCLCNYGIEYVDDPLSAGKIPTVHRASTEKLRKDENYERALENADLGAKLVYQEQAKEIDRIMGEILQISANEQPYDIFICYKETASDGNRTTDSVIAQNIYDALTDKGYKVFFSRITLEDKLGKQYEPYIFAALNSAKIMLAVGTDYEYYNAVWVKNEWSRYLKLCSRDKTKNLIPCYKDMDPYDMPNEFKGLQAQDMGKVGAMQDLLRGIAKIISPDAAKETLKETVVVENGNSTAAPLLKRAFMFLEDGNFDEANQYCEKVLDSDPENAQAYLGKLMAELHVNKQENLKDCANPFDGSNNYQKAMRFADKGLAETLKGYITHIKDRNENTRFTGIYDNAQSTMKDAKSENAYKKAAELFESIPQFKDSKELAKQCLDKAEICRKDAIYKNAQCTMQNAQSEEDFKKAAEIFKSIPGWKDADEQIEICQKRIEEIKAKEEADRVEAARKAEERRITAEIAAKKRKKAFAIGTPIVAACIAFLIVLTTVIIPNSKYNAAVSLMNNGEYNEAITAFEVMDGYKDSADKISACQTALKDIDYNAAISLMNDGKYDEAITAFEALNVYKDSTDKISLCQTALKDIDYNVAVSLLNDGKIIDAYESLVALNGYKDSATKASEIFVQYEIEKLKISEVGDIVYFGAYEQDNNTSNGKEDVEWQVLEKENGKVLVISKYALDCQKYNSTYTDVTWETCSLRKWINGTFLNNAFSAEEQAQIQNTTVSADKNPKYSRNPGNATTDKVFLLSITEAEKYFSSRSARQCSATAYAKAQGASTSTSNGNCWWWLRSPGDRQNYAAHVYDVGSVGCGGIFVDCDVYAVRPALWIELN